jgi:hypothetical protein
MKRQSGITLVGFLIILIILAFFGYTAMKLVPPYIEYMGVVKAMNQVASEPDTASKSPDQIRADLGFKGSFQYVDDDTLGAQAVHVVAAPGGGSLLQVKYDKKIPWIYNIDFLVHFEKSVPLKLQVQQ